MCQTGPKPVRNSPLSQPGPYGYPMRFGVRSAGAKGFKIYGADPKQPFRYIEWHSHRQILHEGAHKKVKTPPLVTISSNWRSKSAFSTKDDAAAFTITVHNDNNTPNTNLNSTNDTPSLNPTPDEPSTSAPPPLDTDTTIALDHTRCRPVTFEFTVAIPTPDGTTTASAPETFAWRRAAPACRETRGLRKKTLPMIETGDERPPEETFVYGPSGSVLVRLAGAARVAPGKDTPLGFTRQGEEIVASYTNSRDGTAWYYFQFWGAGARGELGRAWTDVAVMSGMVVWQDENQEAARQQMGGGSHGVVSVVPSIPGRRGQWPGARHGRAGALWSEAIPGSVVMVPGVMQMPLPPVAVEEMTRPEDQTEQEAGHCRE